MENIITRDGLLYDNGRELNAQEADKVAKTYGYANAELLVEALEKTQLNDLTKKLAEAKCREKEIKNSRIFLEEEIGRLVKTSENGSKTIDAGDGLKVCVKRELGYKADIDAIRNLDIPEEVMPLKQTDPVPAGYDFDKKEYERILEDHPDVAVKIAPFVQVVPKKISVTLKVG